MNTWQSGTRKTFTSIIFSLLKHVNTFACIIMLERPRPPFGLVKLVRFLVLISMLRRSQAIVLTLALFSPLMPFVRQAGPSYYIALDSSGRAPLFVFFCEGLTLSC